MPAAENIATIEKLYAALNAHDGETMASCYAPDATFQDPAFGKLTAGGGQDMWRMLTSRPDSDLVVKLADKHADDTTGTGHWLADYTFPDTGKKVHNDVRAAFKFDADGLITEHVDTFDLRAWAGQALGATGKVLGLTPFLGKVIKGKTAGKLAEYRAAAK